MIYIGCSTQARFIGLTDLTGALVNNASVVATLFDGDGNSIYSLTLVSTGSGGNYTGTIPASVTQELEAGGTYTLNVVSSVVGVQVDERNEQVQVTYRGLNQ